LFPTAYAAAKSLLWSQTYTSTMAEIQCRFSFVCIQIKLQGVRNVMWDCVFQVLQEYHSKVRFSEIKQVRACTHIKHITTIKACTLHFTMFKNKYLGLCGCYTSGVCTCFH
jgi:hypothetical protein